MNAIVTDIDKDNSRSRRLKAATAAAHERLDKRIMAGKPFESRDRYGRFVLVQHGFHRDIDALYRQPALAAVLDDLPGRRRLDLIAADAADLGLALPAYAEAPVFADGAAFDLPTALGWLYVAEGSNLGAAFLLKAAAAIGLSETFGARHLAAAPEGRGLHWRSFTATLDAPALSAEEEARVIAGGTAAFDRVRGFVETIFVD